MNEVEVLTADFLILGGGAAGCMAAIKAAEAVPALDVVLLEKAEISRSGAAGRGMDALNNVVVPGVATVEEYIEAIQMVTEGILDPTISQVIAERSFDLLRKLEDWGCEFPRDSKGQYIVGSFHPKGRFLVEMRGDLKKILAKKVEATSTRVYNRHVALALIKEGEHAAGAVALDLRQGVLRAFLAPAVLLAMGGAARIGLPNTGYLHGTFDCPWCNGEAWKMGFEAGAELTGFEYTATSSMTKDFNGPGQSTFIRHGAWLVNGLGERFMERYDPVGMERAPAGLRAKAMLEEIRCGRGPIGFSCAHLPEETIRLIEDGIFETERPTMRDYFKKKGLDLRRDPVEVVMSEVYLCGGHGLAGFVADDFGETTVKGLYAAGDCLANPYGFLVGAMVMGEAAAQRVAFLREDRPQNPGLKETLDRLQETLARHHEGKLGVSVREFEYKFRRLVNEYVAPPKSQLKLTRFLRETEGMLLDQEDLPARQPHEIMKLMEAKAGLFSARMAALASLYRTESRFGLYHQRLDFPQKDDLNWKTRVILSPGPKAPVARKERP
ncbi:MAG: FAD-dependent oxidoreductase [bacterium]